MRTSLFCLFSLVCVVSIPPILCKFDRKLFRTYFGCPTCIENDCPRPEEECELVKEPGVCACCYTCAKQEGDKCGVHLVRCASGLECRPIVTGNQNRLQALLLNRGVCSAKVAENANSILPPHKSSKFTRGLFSKSFGVNTNKKWSMQNGQE